MRERLLHIFQETHRELRPRTPVPELEVEFFPFANINNTIRLRAGKLSVRLSDLLEGATEPVLRAIAHILLERGAKRDVLIRLLGDAMERWPGFRGPRTATPVSRQGSMPRAGSPTQDRPTQSPVTKPTRPSTASIFRWSRETQANGFDRRSGLKQRTSTPHLRRSRQNPLEVFPTAPSQS